MNKQHLAPPFIGGSSFLIIFAVLCMTIFTLLALSTVQANEMLNQESIQAVSDYYNADKEAELILSQLRQGIIPEQVNREGELYSYSCPISDTQTLEVTVQLTDKDWTILKWQAVSAPLQ